ncbi:hypothetical protein SAMN05443245_4655 [Paraburkholderia fungorum]|uniref:Uncharacterized protein n=1 Tax=Paraburkholderia fungorum TaxID=134537 RepID=A0A1H1I4H0_9BURK|nr:hypothetical protein [Paraburkholderia fungorum]SDR32607.1 hypothetical protein SAMN05443245_4655 [Paraburkholderia fungorum]
MDIFYYWQKLETNLKHGEVGYFASNNAKLSDLAGRLPNRIWVFKTPKGKKGSIQLVGSLLVCDEPCVAVNTNYANVIYYDPFSPESVIYAESGTAERIAEVSGHFQYRFHAAFSANFHGDAGIQALEANVVRELETMVGHWPKVQMLEKVQKPEKVYPINPFARPAQ